jgi:hypothetical protein
MEIVFTNTGSDKSESCRGSLSYVRPKKIRLRGTSASFFTVFELVAGSESVWLDIPREELLVFGARSDPSWNRLPLSPEILLIALLADPCPGESCLREPLRLEEDEDALILAGRDWSFGVSRETGLPLRYRGPPERPFEVVWRDWGLRSGIAWPHEIEIHPEGEGEIVRVRMGRILIGKKVSEKLFELEPKESREILSPQEARGRWRQFLE